VVDRRTDARDLAGVAVDDDLEFQVYALGMLQQS
jgi:hypothetical protein